MFNAKAIEHWRANASLLKGIPISTHVAADESNSGTHSSLHVAPVPEEPPIFFAAHSRPLPDGSNTSLRIMRRHRKAIPEDVRHWRHSIKTRLDLIWFRFYLIICCFARPLSPWWWAVFIFCFHLLSDSWSVWSQWIPVEVGARYYSQSTCEVGRSTLYEQSWRAGWMLLPDARRKIKACRTSPDFHLQLPFLVHPPNHSGKRKASQGAVKIVQTGRFTRSPTTRTVGLVPDSRGAQTGRPQINRRIHRYGSDWKSLPTSLPRALRCAPHSTQQLSPYSKERGSVVVLS